MILSASRCKIFSVNSYCDIKQLTQRKRNIKLELFEFFAHDRVEDDFKKISDSQLKVTQKNSKKL